jgi:hypothetical protein
MQQVEVRVRRLYACGGRLGGYLLFALLAWAVGGLLLEAGSYRALMIGGTYIGLSILLLAAVFRKKRQASGGCALSQAQARFRRWPALIPVGMGLLAGLKVCLPLLLAFTDAAGSGTFHDGCRTVFHDLELGRIVRRGRQAENLRLRNLRVP